MQKIKITTAKLSEEHKRLIAEASLRNISSDEEKKLLDSVRKGNVDAMAPLINGSEQMIVKLAIQLAIQYDASLTVIPQLIKHGRQSLEKLARQELNSQSTERFIRFGAWVVKQQMIKAMNDNQK